MQYDWVYIFLFPGSLAVPRLFGNRGNDKFEWTSLGDSYASGVGSENYVDGRRCLRYDQAYPVLLNGDPDLADGDCIFNNVVCSGAHYNDVEKFQFYDEDTSNQPNWLFGALFFKPPNLISAKYSHQARSQAEIWQPPDGYFGRWRG